MFKRIVMALILIGILSTPFPIVIGHAENDLGSIDEAIKALKWSFWMTEEVVGIYLEVKRWEHIYGSN